MPEPCSISINEEIKEYWDYCDLEEIKLQFSGTGFLELECVYESPGDLAKMYILVHQCYSGAQRSAFLNKIPDGARDAGCM